MCSNDDNPLNDPHEAADSAVDGRQIDAALELAARVLWRSDPENRQLVYTMPDKVPYVLSLMPAAEADEVGVDPR